MIPYNNKKAHEETYTTFVHNTAGKGGGREVLLNCNLVKPASRRKRYCVHCKLKVTYNSQIYIFV
jgi:hypothetical protein